jgi:small conductance mechanosensitive channel
MELSLSEIVTDILERGRELMLQTAAAVVVAAVIIVLGRLVRPLLHKYLSRRGRPSRTRVFTALYRISVAMVAVLLALTLAFPSVRVADVLASLGILSVAVGFAFKNVLENLLAGVLLLLRDPFKSGDQIKVGDAEGTVEGVTVRETLLRTYDGQLVLIPNAQVYTSPLEVRTHYPYTRVHFALAFPAETDLRALSPRLLDILLSLTPDAAPKPEFLITSVRDGAVEVELRLWSLALRSYTTRAVHDAIAAVLDGLNELGVAVDEPAIVVKGEATGHAASMSPAPQDTDDARP